MKRFIVPIFLSLIFAFPMITTDRGCTELKRLKQYYSWVTFKRVQIIIHYCNKYNLEIDKVCSLINEESRGHGRAISVSNARGLMQIMPFHHKGHPDELFNDELNIYYGTKILRSYMNYAKRVYGKNYHPETYRFYNAGPSNPHGRRSSYPNWAYVRRILKNIRITRRISREVSII